MIRESHFVGCRDLPDDMAECLDKPWNFVGVVKYSCRVFSYQCTKCFVQPCFFYTPESIGQPLNDIVTLDCRRFVTDDKIEVMVYFGTCNECGSVYWARSGPPFRRAKAYRGEPVG